MPVSRRSYSTDLTDAEWQILEPLLRGKTGNTLQKFVERSLKLISDRFCRANSY